MNLDDAVFVITDTETTGVRVGDDRIIELAAVKVHRGQIVDRFSELINPQRHVPRRITEMTGISTATVFGAPTAAEVLPRYLDFLGDGVFVAHNLGFDQRFIDMELQRSGLPVLDQDTLCTLRLARRVLRGLRSKSLGSLKDYYGIRTPRSHRALDDAEATAVILQHLVTSLRNEQGIDRIDDLLAYQHQRYYAVLREPKHITRIREEVLDALPDRPGVYFHRDGRGQILYIGKAKSLRTRVRSYFTGVEAHAPKTKQLLRAVRDVTWEETGSELAALLLESRLIKTHQPRFNRALMRYRNRPFIRLDRSHRLPNVSWSFDLRNDGAEYFGPLRRRERAEEVVELVNKLFKLRECDESTLALGKPCLYASMQRCTAPCTGGEAAAGYAAEVERVRNFLTGNDTRVLETITARMKEAAAEWKFEEASWYRDQLDALQRIFERQQRIATPVLEHNAVLLQPGLRPETLQIFVIRFGRLVETFDVAAARIKTEVHRLRSRLEQHFDPALPTPDRYRKEEIDEIQILTSWIYHHRDAAEHVHWQPDLAFEAFIEALVGAAGSVAQR